MNTKRFNLIFHWAVAIFGIAGMAIAIGAAVIVYQAQIEAALGVGK